MGPVWSISSKIWARLGTYKPTRGLIDAAHFGAAGKSNCQLQLTLLAAAECFRRSVGFFGQVALRKDVVLLLRDGAASGLELAPDSEMFLDSEGIPQDLSQLAIMIRCRRTSLTLL